VAGNYAFGFLKPQNVADPLLIDPAPVLSAIVADLRRRVPAPTIAVRFHRAVAEAVLDVGRRIRDAEGLSVVALSGGVFQNARLLAETVGACESNGFSVLVHRTVPPNDGGLALGQAVIGSRRALDWQGGLESPRVRQS
jgi:hydrogenase maturation protein HypF